MLLPKLTVLPNDIFMIVIRDVGAVFFALLRWILWLGLLLFLVVVLVVVVIKICLDECSCVHLCIWVIWFLFEIHNKNLS